MSKDAGEIEVEVVELENRPPASDHGRNHTQASAQGRQAWPQWRGRLRRIDTKWWPLWVIPGLGVLILLAAASLLIGALLAFFLCVRHLLRLIFR